MKILKFFIFSLVLIFTTTIFADTENVITVTIDGVPCPFCISVLTKNLGNLPGVSEVKVNEDKHQFTVIMQKDKNLSEEQINKTVKDSGYVPIKTEKSSTVPGLINKIHMDIQNQPCSQCHKK